MPIILIERVKKRTGWVFTNKIQIHFIFCTEFKWFTLCCSKWYLPPIPSQAAVSKAKELVLVHQEYQRGLHVFEDWLEQEQASLASLSHPEGNVDALENTLTQLQVTALMSLM